MRRETARKHEEHKPNSPKRFLNAPLEIRDFLQVRPQRVSRWITRHHLAQVFTEAGFDARLAQRMIHDHGERVGARKGPRDQDDHRFGLQAAGAFLGLGDGGRAE